MRMSDFIIEVSEADFEYEVLAYSGQLPVVVAFCAPWSAPCGVLEPLLEKLTEEAEGDFRLAKVNADHNPKLVRQYHVHNLPAVKVFRQGQVAAEFGGLRSELELRELLRTVIPNEYDLALEGRQLAGSRGLHRRRANLPGSPARCARPSRRTARAGQSAAAAKPGGRGRVYATPLPGQ